MVMSQVSPSEIASRLRIRQADERSCKAAIRGKKIPPALGYPLTRLCVIRGIRTHDGYGEELRGTLPEFTQALNARSIMSGRIPSLSGTEDTPYCIWYPEIPSEATLRALAQRYKHMLYQVARACAVAGYVDLYLELDVLPEVHIAEEARECGNLEIYRRIMSAPVRYEVMNDYLCTIASEPKPGARLNGDTAVRRSLDSKQELQAPKTPDELLFPGFDTNLFNITGDMNIDLADSNLPLLNLSSDTLRLLSTPLPYDLPIVDKDLLILMAAYHGDIDRYARLRRPNFIPKELECCIRGIFHNTSFALWWTAQEREVLQDEKLLYEQILIKKIGRAISARMIMNNVLARMTSNTYKDPYLIWYPSVAAESTCRQLHRIRPSMSSQILRACMAGGYTSLFEQVLQSTIPDEAVMAHAKEDNGIYLGLLEQKLQSLNQSPKPVTCDESWQKTSTNDLQTVSTSLWAGDVRSIGTGFDGLYEGYMCNAQAVEMLVSMPEHWRQLPMDELSELDYVDWPPVDGFGNNGDNGR